MKRVRTIYLCQCLSISLLGIFITACHKGSSKDSTTGNDETPLRIQNALYASVPSVSLEGGADTLMTFTDIFPVGVRVFDDNIVIKTAKSDSCIYVYDRNTFDLRWITGRKGNGPEDVSSPAFFASVDSDSIPGFRMADVSENSQLYFNTKDRIITKTRFPDYVGFSSSINLLDRYTVAARNDNDCMFYIFDDSSQELLPVGYDIDCGEKARDKMGNNIGYLLSATTYANADNNRVIVPHFFFDIYSIYDLSGSLLKKVCLSADVLDEKDAAESLLQNDGYIGYTPGFYSQEACYLARAYFPTPQSSAEYQQIVKTDWDGNPIVAYTLANHLSGDFCVTDDCLYGIGMIEDDDSETYALFRLNLTKQ